MCWLLGGGGRRGLGVCGRPVCVCVVCCVQRTRMTLWVYGQKMDISSVKI